MKPTRMEREELLKRIEKMRIDRGLSYAAIAALADVDPSQVSRICRGRFSTFSDSVVRICNVLAVQEIGGEQVPTSAEDLSWAKLQRSMRRAWDKTPKGADQLTKILAAVADIVRDEQRQSTGN